jgi:hypothetical protein
LDGAGETSSAEVALPSPSYGTCRARLARPALDAADDRRMHTPQPDYPTPVEPVRPEPSPNDPKPIPQPMQ